MSAFAGFDAYGYPGDAAMDWLRKNTNLCWAGFYLAPAPSHGNASWMPHRARMVSTGWGIAPIYVGQETVGPGAHNVTAVQGAKDGANAAALMVAAGFPQGSCVYLDLENGPPFGAAERAYVQAWVQSVEETGYLPGVYCSYGFAAQLHALVPSARVWVFHVNTTNSHFVRGPNYPDMPPASSGYAAAVLWQFTQSARILCPGVGTLLVDLDTSSMADPSAPDWKPPTVENDVADLLDLEQGHA